MSLRKLLRWDEDSRQAAYADYYDELERCGDCGQLREVCSDPKQLFYPQRIVCYSTMQRQGAARTYERRHEARPYHDGTFSSWAKEASDHHPFHFMDGVSIFAATEDLFPDDEFLAPTSFSMSQGVDGGNEAGTGSSISPGRLNAGAG